MGDTGGWMRVLMMAAAPYTPNRAAVTPLALNGAVTSFAKHSDALINQVREKITQRNTKLAREKNERD